MSKAIKKSTTKLPKAEIPNPRQKALVEAEKQMGAVLNQMHGLQCFLRALGEANSHVSLDDLTFGFTYLLEATQGQACVVQKLIREAQKGGAA